MFFIPQQAQSALIYDAVTVVAEALTRLKRKKLDAFGETTGLSSARRISCDTADSDQSIWEHGEKITRFMRKVRLGEYSRVVITRRKLIKVIGEIIEMYKNNV